MPRAHRHFLPGHVWHITHRCHQREFLFNRVKDRECWRLWLYQARRRYGLSVLNYIITSNHIHLLVRDKGEGEISKSLQLIDGRTAQAYNQRKNRKGAFWEDRYHATAVEADSHLARCMVYIDLNMVRAGVVTHPEQWRWSGYREIQTPPQRYRVIDYEALMALWNTPNLEAFQDLYRGWVADAISKKQFEHDPAWSNSLAVGSSEYVQSVRDALGVLYRNRSCIEEDDRYILREDAESYRGYFGG